MNIRAGLVGAWRLSIIAVISVLASSTLLVGCGGVEKRPGLLDVVLRPRDIDLTLAAYTFDEPAGATGDQARGARAEALAAAVAAAGADIVALHGATRRDLDDLAARLGGFAILGSGADDGVASGAFAALAVRAERFDIIDEATFWLSDAPERPGSATWGNTRPRTCTLVRLRERARGRTLTIASTQLDEASARSRDLSVQLIARRISASAAPDEPAVLLANLAMPLSTPASRLLTGAMRPALEPLPWPATAGPDPLRDFRPLTRAADNGTSAILVDRTADMRPAPPAPAALPGFLLARCRVPG
jgi:endonuclease/exonuclease/phosphatase family metal-dependent hydrolase